jgi:hypothetical protein
MAKYLNTVFQNHIGHVGAFNDLTGTMENTNASERWKRMK